MKRLSEIGTHCKPDPNSLTQFEEHWIMTRDELREWCRKWNAQLCTTIGSYRPCVLFKAPTGYGSTYEYGLFDENIKHIAAFREPIDEESTE